MADDATVPTADDIRSYLVDRSNWRRWGDDDQVGAVNLISPAKRLAALQSTRSGRTLSISRPIDTRPSMGNSRPAQHFMTKQKYGLRGSSVPPATGAGGYAADFYGVDYHGPATTHLDALCHVWDDRGMWNGRNPDEHIGFSGATFGGIENWADGIITRGVLLDVPRFRGEPFVTQESPVHGQELADIVAARGITLEPGDAVCVYSGREKWQRAHPKEPYGRTPLDDGSPHTFAKPGLHTSCLPFLRDNDLSLLVWDMLDLAPFDYDIPWSVHGAIHAYGIAVLDNALLEPLAIACVEEGRDDFVIIVAPLVVPGGTGSPVNPIVVF